MTEPVVKLRLSLDSGQFVGDVRVSQRALADLGGSANQTGNTLRTSTNDLDRFGSAAERVSRQNISGLNAGLTTGAGLARQMGGALAGIGVAAFAKELSSTADEYTNLSSKVRLVTSSEQNLIDVRTKLYGIAQDTRADLSATSDLYTRLTRATTTLFIAEQDRLRISETVNKSFAVSGASANEAGAAITQFSQGLQSGALRGDEFNSVAEQAPVLMELFAKSLGKTRGELRAMAEAGQLTAGILTRALLDGSRDIDKQFAQMTLTIGGASTQLANAWTRWIGESNEGVGASRLAASAISLLADNLGAVATLVLGIATVWGVRYVAGITAAALATRAQAAAAAAAAATNTAAQLAEARAAETAAVAHLARMRALEAGIGSTGRAVAAEQALAAAQARTAAATEAATAAAITKVGALSRLGSGLSALVGGPLGATVIALGALYLAYESVNKAARDWEEGIAASSTQLDSAAAKTLSLNSAMKQLGNAPIPPIVDVAKLYIDNVDLIVAKHTELRDRTAELNDAIGGDWRALFASGNYTAPPEVQAVIDQVVKLESDLHRLEAAQASLGASLRGTVGPALDDAGAAFARFRTNADVGSILLGVGEGFAAIVGGTRTLAANANATTFFGDLSKKASDANEKLKTAGKSAAEVARAYVEQGLAAARLAGMSAELIAQKEREGNAYVATVAALDRAKASHTSTASAERLHDQQARQLEKTIEAQARATDDLSDIQSDLAAGLSGPVARAMNEHQRLLDRITKAAKVWLDQGPPTAAVQAEIARVLADANAQHDVRLRQAEDETDFAARTLEQLDQEIRLRGLSNEARTAEEVVIQAVNRAKEQGEPLSEEEIRQLRAGVTARQEMLRSIDGAREAYESNQRAYGNMVNSMADLGADVLTRQIRTWSDFRDALVGIVVDMVRQIIANWLRVQMLGNGGGGGFMNSVVQMFSGSGGGATGGGFSAGNNSLTGRAGQYVAPWLANNPGLVGNVGAWGGAVAGANYGWNNRGSRNGSGGSVGAAATYGVAGWAAGTVAAGAVLGGSAAVAAGGTAVAGAATGAMGAMAAIPVIGWIALAIALIDKFTGGKVFGSRFKPDWATVALNIGASGGDATTTIREVRNRSLFRGREWQNREVESTEDAERAADELFESIGRIMKDDARRLGIEVPPILAASLQTIQDLDEKGRVKSTKFVVEMLGRTWEEATGELAALRITAEERIAVAAAASGGEASRIAEQWRDSAEKLAEGAEFLIDAQTDIGEGRGLLGANTTLTAVTALVQDLANAGETLSQTYARLTVSAESWRRAIDILGADMRTSGDAFVRFSADIVEAAGGIDRANALWSSFFENFGGTDLMQYQLDSVVDAAERELNDIGIDGLISLDAFKERFKAALPTLTPEQIVQWLEAGAALADATKAQESYANAVKAYDDFVSGLRASLEPVAETPFAAQMRSIDQWRTDTIASMQQLARAAGLAAAQVEDLALVEQRVAQLRAQAMRQLEMSTRDLVSQLYGGTPGSLDEVTRRIQQLEAAQNGALTGATDVADASAQRYADELAAIERIRGFVHSLLLNPQLTTLTSEQQLAEAQRQYEQTLARARGGDVQAMQQLPELAQQLLERARGFYSSGDQYQAIFDAVRTQLLRIAPSSATSGAGGGYGGAVTITPSAELSALYEQRDRMLAEQEAETRLAMARQLAVQLRELGESSGRPILELATSLGVKLDLFVRDLGIDVKNVTAQTVLQLADLASTLGISLGELAGAVGASLGDLADANSAINDALEQRINALPAAERALMEPLFRAVEAATNEADANAAIANLQTATNALPQKYRDLLAPLLGMPASAQTAIGSTASLTADVATNTAKFADAAWYGGMSLAFQGDVSNASLVQMHSRLAEIRDAVMNGVGANSGDYGDSVPASKNGTAAPRDTETVANGTGWNETNALAAMVDSTNRIQRSIADELRRLREEVAALRAERRDDGRNLVRAVERVELATSESAQTQARAFQRAKERG